MPDYIEIKDASGATKKISTDELATAIFAQRFKVMFGVDGSATDVSEAAPLPVTDKDLTVLWEGLLSGLVSMPVKDNGGSLTVDASLGSPVGVRLSNGSEAMGSTANRLWVDDGGSSLTVDSTALGTPGEAEATGEGGIVGLLKRLRKLLEGTGLLKVSKIEEALPTGTNSIGKVTIGAELPEGSKAIGSVKVSALEGEPKVKLGEALPTGSNNIGKVGLEPRTSGGLEKTRLLSAAGTNATKVKEAAGQVYGYYLFNAGTATRYLKLYNKASAPTVGTDTPFLTIPIPAGAAANVELTQGIAFATGIGLALTKGMADANTEAVGAEEVVVNLLWK